MQKLKKSVAQVCAIAAFGVVGAGAGAAMSSQAAYAVDCSILPKFICEGADTKDTNSGGIVLFLKWVLTIMTGLVGVAAVGGVIWAGIMYATAGDHADQVKKAKQVIVDVAIGIVAYGLMFIALNWIIPGGVFG